MGSNVYASTELIQMKRGEKVAFSDANKYFDEVKERYGNKFQVHSQGAYHLSNDIANNNLENVASMIYIDKDGYLIYDSRGLFEDTDSDGIYKDKESNEYYRADEVKWDKDGQIHLIEK